MQYIKVPEGYVAVDDGCEIKRFAIHLTEDMEKYNMTRLFEEEIKETRAQMEAEGCDMIAATDYTPNLSSKIWGDNHEIVLKRILSFAKKGSWRFVTEKE